MKLSKIFAAVAVVVLTASCGALGGMATSSSQGSVSGQAAGAALKGLYSQYKTDGKVDVSNINNVLNMVTLAKEIQGLKGTEEKGTFYTDFATGLILGSDNLVTSSNASPVTSILGGLASQNLSTLTGAASNSASGVLSTLTGASKKVSEITEKTEGVANTVSALSSIFGMLQ